jgi:hypothetical protein
LLTAFDLGVATPLACQPKLIEGERRLVPEEGIEPTLAVKRTRF